MKSITEKINEELKKIQELPPLPEIRDSDSDNILLSDKDLVESWTTMSEPSAYQLDDLIIQPLDFANLTPLLNTVSLSGTGASATYNIGAQGSGGASGYQSIYNTAGPTYSWNTLNQPNKVHITGAGIEMDADADITIGGRSMKKILEGIEQRLSILVPDPKKLQQYEALQQAYEHYRTLEALCNQEPDTDKK
jgi:hypothetical protein